jgi:hypothetical protein
MTGNTATSLGMVHDPGHGLPHQYHHSTLRVLKKLVNRSNNIGLGDIDSSGTRPTYLFEQGGVGIHRMACKEARRHAAKRLNSTEWAVAW